MPVSASPIGDPLRVDNRALTVELSEAARTEVPFGAAGGENCDGDAAEGLCALWVGAEGGPSSIHGKDGSGDEG